MAEPTLRDILDALLRLNSKFDHWESRMDRIERRLDILVENASPQAPAPAPIDDEAPSDEPSANEPSIDEPSNDTSLCVDILSSRFDVKTSLRIARSSSCLPLSLPRPTTLLIPPAGQLYKGLLR
jgi:hypothetical protein